MRCRSYWACAPRASASAFSRSAVDEAFCCARSLARASACCARSRCASSCATCALSWASSTLKSGVPCSTSCPSRIRISTMRPSTSGRRSIDCTASIWPVALISSRTVSVRATTTSTGIPIGAPPPGSPAPPALPFLQPPMATTAPATTAHHAPRLMLSHSFLFRFGKEAPAEDVFEPGQRQTGRVARLHEGRVGVVKVCLSLEEVEDRRRPGAVAALLHAEILARDPQRLRVLLGRGARRRVALVCGRHVVQHRSLQVLADGAGVVAIHPRLAERDLALPVVPEGERHAEREGPPLVDRVEEHRVIGEGVEGQTRMREVLPELGAERRAGSALVGSRHAVLRPLVRPPAAPARVGPPAKRSPAPADRLGPVSARAAAAASRSEPRRRRPRVPAPRRVVAQPAARAPSPRGAVRHRRALRSTSIR